MMREQMPVLKVKVKKCHFCGIRHNGAVKVCEKCKVTK